MSRTFRYFLTVSVASCTIALSSLTSLTVANAYPPNNLAEALKRVSDPGRRRVPLLVIDAEGTRIRNDIPDGWSKLNALYPEDNSLPLIRDVSALFDRQIISCTSVQILAPNTRVQIVPNPGPIQEWAKIGRERATRLLFGSFSAGQWATASSAEGIGYSEMNTKDQRDWFIALMPQPFVLKQVKSGDSPYSYITYGSDMPTTPPVTIAPDQVRLRARRTMSWMYGQKNNPQNSGYSGFGVSDGPSHAPNSVYWIQESLPEEDPQTPRDRMGKAVRFEEPNRLKRGDLSFSSAPLLGKMITVSSAETVGDLVKRVAEATGLELYVDRRVSGCKLSILPEGGDLQADAADVMKALCYGVAGTIRAVTDPTTKKNLYILTWEKEGLMSRRVHLAEWADDIGALTGQEQVSFDTKTQTNNYVKGVDFAPDSGVRVDASVMESVEKEIITPKSNNYSPGVKIPVTALSPEAQAQVKQHKEQSSNWGEGLDYNNVYASFNISVQLVVPGYGAFSGSSLSSLPSLLPKKPSTPAAPMIGPTGPISLPPPLAQFAALQIAPKNDAETGKAVIWARRHGFKALFLLASLWKETETAKLLKSAIEIGKRYGIDIYAVVPVLQTPIHGEGDKDSVLDKLPRAQNLFGETMREYAYRRKDAPAIANTPYYLDRLKPYQYGEWLDVTDVPTRHLLSERLGKIAGTPGLTGIVLTDTAAPGMAAQNDTWMDNMLIGLNSGYNERLRVALIRQANIDPIDLSGRNSMGPWINLPTNEFIPFFPDGWDANRRTQATPVFKRNEDGTWTREAPSNDNRGNGYEKDTNAVWNQIRRETDRTLIGEIRRDAALPSTVSVLVAGNDAYGGTQTSWYASWPGSDPLLPLQPGDSPLLPLGMSERSSENAMRYNLSVYLQKRIQITKTPDGKQKASHSGLVLDGTAVSVAKALSLLEPLTTVNE